MLTGFAGSRMSNSQIELEPVLLVIEHGLVEHDEEIAVGQGQAIVRPAAERRRPVAMRDQLGAPRSATSIITRPASRQAPYACSPCTIAWCRP